MALIIEDGTKPADANSYVDVADLTAFATERGIDLPAADADKEKLLLKAMDFLESQLYVGARATYAQNLQWPRVNVVMYGFPVGSEEIPRELKAAQIQLAVDAQTIDLMPTAAPATKGAVLEESVEGAVSVKYAAPAANVGAGAPAGGATLSRAMALLRPLLRGGMVARVAVRRA